MNRIKCLPVFILSVFLGGYGFSASLAMEEDLEARPASHGAAEAPLEKFLHEERLLETLHAHMKGSPLSHDNLFFVPYSSDPIRSLGDELSIHAKASQTKITNIHIYPAQGNGAPPSRENRPKIEQDSRSFLEALRRDRPTFSLNLESPSFTPHCNLIFDTSSSPLEITHLFALREKEKKRSLESFLSEPKCSVTQKLTTIKGKSLAGEDVQIFLDTTFSMPIHTAINGFFYVTAPSLRSIFIVFLVQIPFSQMPQFVITPYSKIEDAFAISALENWIFVGKIPIREEETRESSAEDPAHEAAAAMAPPVPPSSHAADEAPIMPKKHYFQVRFFPGHALPSYNKDWWRNWVSSPEEIFQNKSLRAFLGFFIERLMRDDSKSKGSFIGTIRGVMEDGFYEVSSREPLQAHQIHVEVPHAPPALPNFTNVTMEKLVLRQEKTSRVTTAVGYAKGPIVIESVNMDPTPLIPGVYNISDSEDPLSMKWHHEDEEAPPLVLRREKGDEPSALKVSYTAESRIPFTHLLQATRLPWMTHLCVENTDILRADPSHEVFTLGHLSSLTLRNCGLENASSEFFTQLIHLRRLKTLDVSQNLLMPELFFQFLTILGTSSLPANGSLSIENLVLTLPPKPSPARTRALVGTLLTGTAAAAVILTTPVGWIVGAGIAAGAVAGGGVGGAVSQNAAALVKQGSISHWTLTCVTPLLPIPSLKTVTVFSVPRNPNGCEKTITELNKLRQQASLPEISFSLHPKKMPPRREGAAGDEEWNDWEEV